MIDSPVLIAGAGIGGLSVALTLHQIGVPCVVFESVPEIKPLGVGINLQPNAVREMYELGFGPEALDTIGVQTREWALVGLNGNEVYSEWRGIKAGYRWPPWNENYFLVLAADKIHWPWLAVAMKSGYARGAVTGLGLLNILLGVWEIINFKKTARAFQLEWQGEDNYSRAFDAADLRDHRSPALVAPGKDPGTDLSD